MLQQSGDALRILNDFRNKMKIKFIVNPEDC